MCPSPSRSKTSKTCWHMSSPKQLFTSTVEARNSVYSMVPLPLTSTPSRISRSSRSERSPRPLRARPARSSVGESRPSPSTSSARKALRRGQTSASSSSPATTWSTAFENTSRDRNLRRFSTRPQGMALSASASAPCRSQSSRRASAAVGLLHGSGDSSLETSAWALGDTRAQCFGTKSMRPLATFLSMLSSDLPRNGGEPHRSTWATMPVLQLSHCLS
mmetsp:Transcript_13484/g.35804  ORF Transcript_13484/g.35804 Transcript_13484/m.35804 type:complete len:219 (-) Transcript_13484:5-661(-)